MRLSLRAVGMALVITAIATSGRCDDNDRGPFVFTTTADSGATPPPPAAPAPAIADVPAKPCDNLAQAAAPTPSPFDGDLCTRPLLLGSICGVRDQLAATRDHD